ncbi:MAG: type I methionyl aminopeptidase [Chloroflexi bacterium]|nr:type I methionyl aminopeptidase [Chloroflexota bacterium]
MNSLIRLKTPAEIRKMREAGRIVAEVHDGLTERIRPGVKIADLDAYAETWIRSRGAIPAFKGYPHSSGDPRRAFPATICASVNDEIVHGIPDERILQEGDIIGVDCGAILDGWYGDAARTYPVGGISEEASALLDATRESLEKGIRAIKVGRPLGSVGNAIQRHVEPLGYSVVREFVGHGIGSNLHEEPKVPNYGSRKSGPTVEVGLTIAIEPMVNAGGFAARMDSDGWTVRTADGRLSAHFENSVAVTNDGVEVLTAL